MSVGATRIEFFERGRLVARKRLLRPLGMTVPIPDLAELKARQPNFDPLQQRVDRAMIKNRRMSRFEVECRCDRALALIRTGRYGRRNDKSTYERAIDRHHR